MAGVREMTAAEFLRGTTRQALFLQRNTFIKRSNLLWGKLCNPKGASLRCFSRSKVKSMASENVRTSLVDEQSGLIGKPAQEVIHFYRVPLIQESANDELLKSVQTKVSSRIVGLKTEQCFNIGLVSKISKEKLTTLKWILGETYEPENLATESFLAKKRQEGLNAVIVEVGPRLSFTTAWSSNAVSIFQSCGLFDEQDLQYYTRLFMEDIKRNPTNVELFDITQSNSEHSRHWFFTGKIVIDGQHMDRTLMQIVKSTLKANPSNSVIGFKDNSSAIKGFLAYRLQPVQPGTACPLKETTREIDVLFTAETHNFPCAVAPYPGAETGAGGRIRDKHATGRGFFVVAATAGYTTGNLNIDPSSGALDYGNKFGEPLIQGFTRTFGMRLPSGERREWLKPIMFSGGIGHIDHTHISKGDPEIGMLVVKIGGPAYRIGMGGGAASSMVSGQNDAELDFNAVQRGDAEMAQKLYRVVCACIEMGEDNPIISIHDQGAGGNCNVVKEIIFPKGAEIDIRAIVVCDHTMSVLEIWGAQYQEQDAILVKPGSRSILESICSRERLSMAIIGSINGEGRVVLVDSLAIEKSRASGLPPLPPAVDLELEKVLGDMPKKSFEFKRVAYAQESLDIAPGTTVMDSLKRVLRLPSVCSKRFLTTKVDRCVTGLVAQQQTVGPLQLPLADVAVIAQSYVNLNGVLVPSVTALSDVKASGNWMYPAKLEGEGAAMYDAAIALSNAMIELGIAIDGGKDSLSMAAHAGGEVVEAPGNLVISAYVTCPDITKTVTPDLKLGDNGILLHIDLAKGKQRLGGSALAQVFDQIGNDCPDLDDVSYLKRVFEAVQDPLGDELISAGHDISDGWLLVCALEMAFSGNCGIVLDLASRGNSVFPSLFAEELGLILEVSKNNMESVMEKLSSVDVAAEITGQDTSFQLEKLQRLTSCVESEKEGLKFRHEPSWPLSFTPSTTDEKYMTATSKPKVAIIREEGSNGDREMSAAFYAAGFEPWDFAMQDLLKGVISLNEFRGIAFVGGFSYADVLDSAKGWAASIRFNQPLLRQFQEFYKRPDMFSLRVCNGCQLMALLGWVPGPQVGGVLGAGGDPSQPRFINNEFGRFECRFTSVSINNSPAIMFKGMEGSTLGVWAAHGEGRAYFPDDSVLDRVVHSDLAPLRYCDDDGNPTEAYPFNLNGSPLGVAAICSPDGRHLAMMPHPERCFLMWQFPWYPKDWNVDKKGPSPWLRMFQNAREWCS
ncbi:putative phosphoribosylformylglycinamidine synthase [Hibiscus syriacus]|uniref:Phosphoribosylformylglycinamidine synthase n=1 Tax=Hibiscus syriacus TaxID=106335 RepID=A0A6A3AGU9_HIBSY|nr:putative phosphoribosylformylglycinamidine synthase [Hibiscus syriacus]